MTRSRLATMLVLALVAVATLSPSAFAAKAQTLFCTWQLPQLPDSTGLSAFGVFDDGNVDYTHGSATGLRCYFAVNGTNIDLVTYNTLPSRKLRFKFDPASSAPESASLPDDFVAEVDLFGINYFGPYRTMVVNTSAQVQADLEFHYPATDTPKTYELEYSSLAVRRLSTETWLFTSSPFDICGSGNPNCAGFTPSSQAKLNEIRRKLVRNHGTVNMPIRFLVTCKSPFTACTVP